MRGAVAPLCATTITKHTVAYGDLTDTPSAMKMIVFSVAAAKKNVYTDDVERIASARVDSRALGPRARGPKGHWTQGPVDPRAKGSWNHGPLYQ